MNICFYAPFKPLGHRNPSGDLVTASGLYQHLTGRGHTVRIASALRTRWIFWKPWLIPLYLRERQRIARESDWVSRVAGSLKDYPESDDVLRLGSEARECDDSPEATGGR